MADLAKLTRKRGAIKHKLTNFSAFLKPIEETFDKKNVIDKKIIFELKIRVEKFDIMMNEFEEVQSEIEIICEEDKLSDHYTERNNFTDQHSSLLASAKLILQIHGVETADHASDNSIAQSENLNNVLAVNSSNSLNNVKLPTINLPIFKSNMNSWLEFKDTYISLIHSNAQINDIMKFHYLRASLEGDALKVIHSLEFSEQNYQVAWELLCNRYDNSRLLVFNHIQSLFNLDTLQKESASGLRNLIDSVFKHLRSLTILNEPVQYWDSLVIFLISTKLDRATAREWERHKVTNEVPKLSDMQQFLQKKADFLETLNLNVIGNTKKEKDTKSGVKHYSLHTSNRSCNLCGNSEHYIYTCDVFLKLSVPDKISKVKELKLCINCLCKGHELKRCQSGPCRKCKNRHNSLLHLEKESNPPNEVNLLSQTNQYVLLSTASIYVYDSMGNKHIAKAILDCGSQSNFISSKLCNLLRLPQCTTNISITGINNITSNINTKCDVTIESRLSQFLTTISCFILPKITDDLPNNNIDISQWNIPDHLNLADPLFNESGEVDLLLGASVFWTLLRNGKISLGKTKPVLQNTLFGWIIAGPVNEPVLKLQCYFSREIDLHNNLKHFWELEECTNPCPLSADDIQCENFFQNTLSRSNDGRFIVRIPFKQSPSQLGESKSNAIKRLLQLERRFQQNPPMKAQYIDFLKTYESLRHMSRLHDFDESQLSYFLPHHAVVRETSLTTKMRIVFNGSAPSDNGVSSNDLQYIGPPILNDIFSILVRFRQYSIVVSSDIEKMYRQILVHPDDRPFQRIVWRDDTNKPISIYNLNTVVYGTTSAPYLAIRCIKQLSHDFHDQFPVSSNIISRDFYVDDLITGFDTEQEAITICQEISNILKTACFHLRKWTSNNDNVLNHFQDDTDTISVLRFGDNEQTKTLGIQWLCKSDFLTYHISDELQFPTTKRKILSDIAKIYDPLGLLSPCTILAKILIQNLWAQKVDWDEKVPLEIEQKWQRFRQSFPKLNELRIPRTILCESPCVVQLHGFCDASQSAYSASLYCRSISPNGEVHVNLICSKTKVAPLKSQTIPRLELCGALVLARVTNQVLNSLTIQPKCSFWSDSQIVLCWLKLQPSQLNTFVSHRVSEIQSLTNVNDWFHVGSKNNPADLASRGVFPDFLLSADLWWKGPSWLSKAETEWPTPISLPISDELPEMKRECKSFHVTQNNIIDVFNKFSTLTRLQRVTAYCFRFFFNSRKQKHDRTTGSLSVTELDFAIKRLVKLSQLETFNNEIKLLTDNQTLQSSKLLSLAPFVDIDGFLRVGGRLKHSNLNFNAKHPLLLHSKHRLTKLIFEHEHRKLLHAGPQLLLNTIRQTYWPIAGMNLAKRTVRSCVVCFKFKPKFITNFMGDLPEHRVTAMTPFYVTGIDYAGPFFVKDRKGRGCKVTKAYVCLFICFAVKAIHLELVTDLSTECFLAALRRFSARRGYPRHIWSDNATNFAGASKVLNQLHEFFEASKDEILNECSQNNIEWHFIPPTSPHFGGLWESGVKSTKSHLLKVIGDVKLTYEELNTILIQVEATLNSRPMYPMSSDPNDLSPLTPAHFLVNKSLVTVPDPNVLDIPINKLSRYQLLQQINQSFWKRWSNDYLSYLQTRNKWKQHSQPLSIGTLVLLKNENLPPCQWSLGRISHLHPGADDVIRVVTVKTSRGSFKRAITKICPLPLQEASVQ